MRVFICYRRGDDDLVAYLHSVLIETFGPSTVFMDVDDIPLGVDFREHLRQEIGQTDIVLVVMGNNWQAERLHEPEDFVRAELLAARALGKKIVPVLLSNRSMPKVRELPADLEWLPFINGYPIQRHPYVRRDFLALAEHLRVLAAGVSRPTAPPASGPPTAVQPAVVQQSAVPSAGAERTLSILVEDGTFDGLAAALSRLQPGLRLLGVFPVGRALVALARGRGTPDPTSVVQALTSSVYDPSSLAAEITAVPRGHHLLSIASVGGSLVGLIGRSADRAASIGKVTAISESAFDPTALARRLDEFSGTIHAIVPTGGDVTAFGGGRPGWRSASATAVLARSADELARALSATAADEDVLAVVQSGVDLVAFVRPAPQAKRAARTVVAMRAPVSEHRAFAEQLSIDGSLLVGGRVLLVEGELIAFVRRPAGAAAPRLASGRLQPPPPPAAKVPVVAAGWYADPSRRFELRYWDGTAWTEHVSRAGQQFRHQPGT